MSKIERQRKTADPCTGCFLHLDLCLCADIPSLDFKTRMTLIVHAKELKRTTNTGRLAVRALKNSEMRVRGLGALDLSDLLNPAYRPVLFYPSEHAVELTPEFLAEDQRPVHLIVPDGNWRQASKVAIRHKELGAVPHVKISRPNPARFFLRAETTPEGMATLQAIAEAFRVLEGEDAYRDLSDLYKLKLQRTLKGRGVNVAAEDLYS